MADDLRPTAPAPQRVHPADPSHPALRADQRGVFFTKTYTRIVNPALAELDPQLPAEIATRSPLASSYRAFERAIEDKIKQAPIAA